MFTTHVETDKSPDYSDDETDNICVAGFYLFSHLASDVSLLNHSILFNVLTALVEKCLIPITILHRLSIMLLLFYIVCLYVSNCCHKIIYGITKS